jgi:SAM-dependent methyltransferase
MTPEEAILEVVESFPFPGYMTSKAASPNAYLNIAHTVLRHVPVGGRILDFGCGPCDKTAVLQTLGFVCSGYDDLQDDWHNAPGNRDAILLFAEERGIEFVLASAGPLPFKKASFDLIMLHDVLEHLHDSPRDLLNDLLELAKPEGILFVTVPNAVNIRKRVAVMCGRTNLPGFEGYYWYPGSWRGHVREYVKSDLVKLAEYLALEIVELRGCDHMVEKVPAVARPGYLLATRLFPAWKDSWSLVARRTSQWTPRKVLARDQLELVLGKNTAYEYHRKKAQSVSVRAKQRRCLNHGSRLIGL